MGNCTIDGIDVYAAFGAYITKGGYNDLLLLPALKTPPAEDWPDIHGEKVDLSSPRLAAREVQILFAVAGEQYSGFMNFLTAPGYREITIPSIAYTCNLRYVSAATFRTHSGMSALTVRMAEDGVHATPPTSYSPGMDIPDTGYSIDDTPVKRFGLLMQGRDELLKPAPAKKAMSFTNIEMDGQYYDAISAYKDKREVTFNCRLKAISPEAFRNCREALLYALTRPNLRNIKQGAVTYPCYYKNTASGKLISLQEKNMAFDFRLTLVIP
jgi:hypothetical protein